MATKGKRGTSDAELVREFDEGLEREIEAGTQAEGDGTFDPNVSVNENAPDPTYDPAAQLDPLVKTPQPQGEVLAGASDTDEVPPSVSQNAPDPTFDPASIPDPRGKQKQPEGEVPLGKNEAPEV